MDYPITGRRRINRPIQLRTVIAILREAIASHPKDRYKKLPAH